MTSGDEPDENTRREARQQGGAHRQDDAQPTAEAPPAVASDQPAHAPAPGEPPAHATGEPAQDAGGQPQHEQPQHEQPQHDQAAFGQPPYGQPGQPQQGYQSWSPASRGPSPWIGQRLIGGAALLVAAGLTLGGTFLTLFTAAITEIGDTTFTLDATGWEFRAGANFAGNELGDRLTELQNGIPLAVAGGLMLVAAVLAVLAAVRSASPVFRGAALLVGTAGVAFLLGAISTMLVEMNYFADSFDAAAGNGRNASLGAGGWLEIVGIVLAIAGVVLVAGPWGGRRDNRATPPFGSPAPVARG